MLPMKFNKLWIGLCQFFRQPDRSPLERKKTLLQCWLRKITAQSLAQNDSELCIQRDEPRIKRRVMESGKTKAVARIKSFCREFTPRLYVAGDQKSRDIDAADATTDSVGIQDRLTEKLLAAPHFNS